MAGNGHRISFGGDNNVLELDSVGGCIICEYSKNHHIVHFEKVNVWYMNYISMKKNLKTEAVDQSKKLS